MSNDGIEKQSAIIPELPRNKGGNPAWVKGVSGNPNGRPANPEIQELREAIRIAKKKNGNRSILVHFVERAYFNDAVLVALIKKLIPDKVHKEIEVDEDLKELIGQRIQINVIGVAPSGNDNQLRDSSQMPSGS